MNISNTHMKNKIRLMRIKPGNNRLVDFRTIESNQDYNMALNAGLVMSRTSGNALQFHDILRSNFGEVLRTASNFSSNASSQFTKTETGLATGSLPESPTEAITFAVNTVTATSAYHTDYPFAIIRYTGNGVPRSIPHPLGITPEFIIVKGLSLSVHIYYVKGLAANQYLPANNNNVQNSTQYFTNLPDANVVNIGTNNNVNRDGFDFMMYMWASHPNLITIDSYLGDQQPQQLTPGFEPDWFIQKPFNNDRFPWIVYNRELGLGINDVGLDTYQNISGQSGNLDFDFIRYIGSGWEITTSSPGFNKTNTRYGYMGVKQSPR